MQGTSAPVASQRAASCCTRLHHWQYRCRRCRRRGLGLGGPQVEGWSQVRRGVALRCWLCRPTCPMPSVPACRGRNAAWILENFALLPSAPHRWNWRSLPHVASQHQHMCVIVSAIDQPIATLTAVSERAQKADRGNSPSSAASSFFPLGALIR